MNSRRHLAADVVEVDVDAVRARLLQCGVDVVVLVVDRHVVAVHSAVGAFVRAARDPDCPTARELGDLADDLPDCSRRARDDDGVARQRPADVEQAEVGRKAGRPYDMESERRRIEHLRNPPQRATARDRVLLPAELADDQISRRVPTVVTLDHLAQRL
jgi:hypothetical protein